MRRFVLAAAGDHGGPLASAAAQQAGTFEVGLFPHISYFDRSLVHDPGVGPGPGARLGYFITDHLAVEAEGGLGADRRPERRRRLLHPAPGQARAQRAGRASTSAS